MNIRNKLLYSYISLIFFSIGLSTIIICGISKTAILKEVQEKNQNVTDLIFNLTEARENFLLEKTKTDLYLIDKHFSNINSIYLDYNDDDNDNHNDDVLPSLCINGKILRPHSNFMKNLTNYIGAYSAIYIYDKNKDKFIRISPDLDPCNSFFDDTAIESGSTIYNSIIDNQMFLCKKNNYTVGYKSILDDSGEVIGAFCVGYPNLDASFKKIMTANKLGSSGYVYIMDSSGNLLFHPNYENINVSDQSFFNDISLNKNGSLDYEFEGKKKIASYRYFEPWDWYIITICNFDDFHSPYYEMYKNIFLVAISIIFLSIILALILSNKFVTPIKELKSSMELVTSGNLEVRSRIKSKDEIGILSNSFNILVETQEKHVNQILEYDKAKNEFFANISHELRTPLNIIFSTSQLFGVYLKDSKDEFSPKLVHYNTTIRQNCYRLLKLVNNIIDINKLDSGFLNLNLRNANIVEVIEDITLSTVDYIHAKNKCIIFDTNNEEIITAIDAQFMERIILNLISNAVKFTNENATITVSVLDKVNYVEISVQDTGIGIPYEDQHRIFERFKQVDPILSRKREGSGIGLSLVKSLVELHKGTINLESTFGKGTTFTIKLPICKVNGCDKSNDLSKYDSNSNVEKIDIEFSDIYS